LRLRKNPLIAVKTTLSATVLHPQGSSSCKLMSREKASNAVIPTKLLVGILMLLIHDFGLTLNRSISGQAHWGKLQDRLSGAGFQGMLQEFQRMLIMKTLHYVIQTMLLVRISFFSCGKL
jgi:hypothetical protein